MLETLDLLIGLTVVMLFLSMAVTLLTQIFIDLFNQRGRFLHGGVSELLHLIDAGIDRKTAKVVANFILRDEMVTGRFLGFFWRRVANAVHREELTKLILGFAVDLRRPLPVVQEPAVVTPDNGADAAPTTPLTPDQEAALRDKERQIARTKAIAKAKSMAAAARINPNSLRAWWWRLTGKEQRLIPLLEAQYLVRQSLSRNGIADAAAVLSDIRMAALRYEQTNPDMSNCARQNAAILTHADSQFVAKLNGWFDQTIDRVTDRFTASTRFVTLVAAIIVAVALQVDSVALINRLSTDDATRDKLVAWAIANSPDLDPAKVKVPADLEARKAWLEEKRQTLTEAAGTELISVPKYDFSGVRWTPWRWDGAAWARLRAQFPDSGAWPGILLTAALLSLGAPFWYEMLKNLLKLRSVLSAKDDTQREERQTTQAPQVTGSGGSTVAAGGGTAGLVLGGERGDLDAAG